MSIQVRKNQKLELGLFEKKDSSSGPKIKNIYFVALFYPRHPPGLRALAKCWKIKVNLS